MLSAPSYVVQTWYIERDGRGFYRIELSPHLTDTRVERLVLATTDRGVYHDALAAEGHEVRLVARWHVDADERQICDELLPAPVPLHPDERI
jgi:hypothetical protein